MNITSMTSLVVMPKVLADNEEVNFQEGIPEKPIRIYELLMGALAEQRRSIIKFLVDGKDSMQTGEFAETFELIEAESLTHDEITLRLCAELLNSMATLEQDIQAYQANILITSWTDVFKQMDQFISKIQPFADLIDHVLPYAQAYSPDWKNDFENFAKSQGEILGNILKSFENKDPAGLSNELSLKFLPLYLNVKDLFVSQVIPSLQEVLESGESKNTQDA